MNELIIWWLIPTIIAFILNVKLFQQPPYNAQDEEFLQLIITSVVWPITALFIGVFFLAITFDIVCSWLRRDES